MIADEQAAIRIMRESSEVIARLMRGEDSKDVRARGHSVIAALTQWQAKAVDRQRHTVSDDVQVPDLERAALDVVKAGSIDPGSRRVVVPVDLFDVLRRRLEPIHR